MNTPDPGAAEKPPRRRAWYGAAMKIVRRTHMYLGLLLFPWILLFGISGMLFNHPEIGRDIEQRTLSPAELSTLTGIGAWNPDTIANKVVEKLNADSPGYTLETSGPRAFSGWPLFATPGKNGERHVLILRLDKGGGTFSTHAAGPKSEAPPFEGKTVDLPEYKMAALEAQMKDLLPKLGVDAPGPLHAHPEVNPELRFQVRDANGRSWNIVYNLSSGRLDGRPTAAPSKLRFVELLGKLHTTHHFPVHGGITWLWALFADLTGFILVLWALTGLAMWWQMKPTRVLGAGAIVVAVVIAGLVMSGTAADVKFADVEAE